MPVSKLGVRPLGERVIVEAAQAVDQMTAGGVILPDSARQKPDQAVIVAVGTGDMDEGLVAGSTVFLPPFCGNPIMVNTVEYKVINYEDIIAILD